MGKTQKILTTCIWGLCVLAMVALVTGVLAARRAGSEQAKLDVLFPAPTFSLTDQDNRTITTQSLLGHPWVAGFIFTRCAGPCPMMTGKMAKMQGQIKDEKVKFVLFTVDPEHDSPQVLKEYAQSYQADPSRWHLLTGPKQQLFDAANGLHLTALPASDTNPIVHSEKFLLIDASGQVRGVYDSGDEADIRDLTAHASALAAEAQ